MDMIRYESFNLSALKPNLSKLVEFPRCNNNAICATYVDVRVFKGMVVFTYG
jgi:hypothetical protein